METVKFINATYVESYTRTHQGSRKSIQRFLDNGYHIQEVRNGFYVLVKPANVIAVFQNSTGEPFHYNVKQDILDFYNKERISKNLFEQFYNEATNGNIIFYLDDDVVNLATS